jgi:hypothetical protein
MAINAVAIVHIDPSAVKAALDPAPEQERAKLDDERLDVVEGGDGKYYVIESFGDATAIHLDIPLGHADPEVMGTLVAVALGDIIDEHDDPRGVPLFPESYKPKARTWAGLLEEIGEALDWAPIEGTEIVDPNEEVGAFGPGMGDLAAMAAQMQAQLPPEMLQQAMEMAQKLAGSGAMDEIQRAMQQMMSDPTAENADPPGMDIQGMAQQAQRMLDDNPELQKRLAGQLGITDAQLDDDDEDK